LGSGFEPAVIYRKSISNNHQNIDHYSVDRNEKWCGQSSRPSVSGQAPDRTLQKIFFVLYWAGSEHENSFISDFLPPLSAF